jgi:hypothetical protein
MTVEDVQAARQAIEQRGEYPSADKILTHLGRGSKKTVLRRLRAMAAARSPVPATTNGTHQESNGMATHTVPPPAVPTTLLEQAEQAFEDALMSERRARRVYDLASTSERPHVEEACIRARKARESAATLVQARERARDRLLAALPSARVEARRASGELSLLETEMDKRLIRARREAALAEEDLRRIMQDLVSIAGIVPAEAS